MTPIRRVVASAPSRIDLAGGTLDIWPLSVLVPGASTVNLAIELRARVVIEPGSRAAVRVISRDRRRRVTRRLPITPPARDSPLSMLLRLVSEFDPASGMTLVTEATAPAGAGLGGSSTLGIAAAAALDRFCGTALGRAALLQRVMNLETRELGVPTGNQDYLAALHGGLAIHHHESDGTRREKLVLPEELASRLVLAYTGQPRHSGYSNWDMFRRYIDGEARTVRRMETIARIAHELGDALRAGALDTVGRLLGEEGRLRYTLAPTVGTDALRRAGRVALGAGALGVKVCGAGGGGCLVAFARAGRQEAVARAIAATGATLLPVRPARRGLLVDVLT